MLNITEERIFDLRTLEHELRRGSITEADYKNYLKKLSNDENNVDYIEVFEEEQAAELPDSDLTFKI